jgi:hypothetical protein
MTTQTHSAATPAAPASIAGAKQSLQAKFTPLELETRPTVDTAAASFYLHKAPQTMRIWACKENGPIRARRVGANLHWATADIRKLLGVK